MAMISKNYFQYIFCACHRSFILYRWFVFNIDITHLSRKYLDALLMTITIDSCNKFIFNYICCDGDWV